MEGLGMTVPHELTHRLRATEVRCHVAHALRQHPLRLGEALHQRQLRRVPVDRDLDVAVAYVAVPQLLAQLLDHVGVLLR